MRVWGMLADCHDTPLALGPQMRLSSGAESLLKIRDGHISAPLPPTHRAVDLMDAKTSEAEGPSRTRLWRATKGGLRSLTEPFGLGKKTLP